MGILNATPDSFFDQGTHFSLEKGILHGLSLASQGADILDIGGASSRPGAPQVEIEEEMRRVIPLIEALKANISIPISIDTTHVKVARMAVEKGATLINDINGFQSPELCEFAVSCNAELCLMHRRKLQDLDRVCDPDLVIASILHFFEHQISRLVSYGVKESRIILDPGIGFGKTPDYHIAILKGFEAFKRLGFRLLVSASRKGSMAKILGRSPQDLLAPTLSTHAILFSKGADIFRVHDVKEHRDALDFISHFCGEPFPLEKLVNHQEI